jgi:hypothetical protein
MMCLPIAQRKERWAFGMQRLFLLVVGRLVAQIFLSPIFFFCSLARMFANWTSAIPLWPAEIEASCRIESDDPYVLDDTINDYNSWGWIRG